jgi:hypothetical protein
MNKINRQGHKLWLGAIVWVLWTGLLACARKTDPAVASGGAGVTNPRVVLTMKGAAH